MKRILIIDDNEAISTIYRNKFARRGFVAETAADGVEGLFKLEQWKPNLVLLDLAMPQLDGLSLLRSIRTNAATHRLPVVVYSNSFSQSSADQARKLGATRLLSKSQTRPNFLLDTVAELLGEAAAPAAAPAEDLDRDACTRHAVRIAGEMRPLLKQFFKGNETSVLATLQHRAHAFTAYAWTAGMQRAAFVGEALEVMLRTLCEHPDYVNFSTDKTLLQGIECLESLAANPAAASAPWKPPEILIVDDQELSVLAATRAIGRAKMQALACRDPLEALQLIEARPFDLILLDIDMPDMDGHSLCQRLRRFPWHEKTPVVFFSALSQIEYRIGSAAAGGSDFIGKPFLSIELGLKALVWVWKPKLSETGT